MRWTVVHPASGLPVAAVAVAPSGPALDIDRLVVAPAVMRQGLGRALVETVLAEAVAMGAR